MKHLKLYEEVNEEVNKPKIGDYIVLSPSYFRDSAKIFKIISNIQVNHFGVLTDRLEIEYVINSNSHFYIPNGIKSTGIKYTLTDTNKIVFFSSNIEDCETYLTAKKYNI